MRNLVAAILFLLLAGCASARPIEVQTLSDAHALEKAEPIEIRLSNFKFEPGTIHLTSGKAYRLTLVNDSGAAHNFAAPEFLEAARIASADAEKVASGKIEVAGHSTETILIVPAAGTYDLDCTHFGHAALGMSGRIVVN